MKYRKFVILLFLSLIILCGCSSQKKPTGTYTLWVVTEESCSDGMNYQAKEIAQRMEEEYEGLTVKLDILPTSESEREIILKQLRTKIMAGNGPDVYLLPTGSSLTLDYPSGYSQRSLREISIEPLFLDISQAMRNGNFYDFDRFYSQDSELNPELFREEIMSAGMLKGKRYILPLRFNIPILFVNSSCCASEEVLLEQMPSDIGNVIYKMLSSENAASLSAGIQLPTDESLLPELFDYENEAMLITPQQIASYFRLYQAWKETAVTAEMALVEKSLDLALSSISSYEQEIWRSQLEFSISSIRDFNNIGNYLCFDVHWLKSDLPVFTSFLSNTMETMAVAKLEELCGSSSLDLQMIPFSDDGRVIATVTYYGAIGSNCCVPELAYSFLKKFLSEEFQWDIYRPRIQKSANHSVREVQCDGMVENSWPVLTAGATEFLWQTLQYQEKYVVSSYRSNSNYLSRQVQIMEFTDEDLPVLNWEIDEVRFPITLTGEDSMEYALSLLNEPDGTPTDVDIDALAEKVWQNLWWHLAEG